MDPSPTPSSALAATITGTTTVDKSIARSVWEGRIPLRVEMCREDVGEMGAKEGGVLPQYILAPRITYLPLLTPLVRKHFVESCGVGYIGDDKDIWYSFEGTALKWHYPLGLLYDLHTISTRSRSRTDASPPPTPWKITVHFREFPTDKLIRTHPSVSMDAPHDFFMAMIKEVSLGVKVLADFLRNGNVKKVMSLSKQDQTSLWEGLWEDNFEKFWAVNEKLITNEGSLPKNVPVRVFVPGRPVIQEPIPPTTSTSGILEEHFGGDDDIMHARAS
ncbi:autophagy protein 5 [Quaeritorhiza haematococci]|nr:autophagy protein 5 [Quaeritorhiza haematococci]